MKLFGLTLLFASSTIHAACGDLNIQIINKSSHSCTFQSKKIYYGSLADESIPANISTDQTSPIFTAHQDDTGIGIILTYSCDNEVVKFYSGQYHCSFLSGTGKVQGRPDMASTLKLDFVTEKGSYWKGLPGKITWTIS